MGDEKPALRKKDERIIGKHGSGPSRVLDSYS